jgi:hypothetical protein
MKQKVIKPEGIVHFYYSDQKDFEPGKDHNFDCEAIISQNGSLYLFTKNRDDKGSSLYKIPSSAGNHEAKKLGDFESNGRITGADISPDGSQICLTGYNKKADCFLVTLSDYEADKFLKGKMKKTVIGSFKELGQLESVAFKTNNEVFLTCEKTKKNPAALYLLPLNK